MQNGKRINYEDNIFILNTKIRYLSDLLLLEPEPDFFLDKTMEDIDFVGHCSELLLKNLLENRQLIDWSELLVNLATTEENFYTLLRNMLDGEAALSVKEFPAIGELLAALEAASKARQKTIKENTKETDVASGDVRIVSPEELALLVG